jgi:hypothetical protein
VALDVMNPQSEYAETLLQLVTDLVLSDPWYVERLEQGESGCGGSMSYRRGVSIC